MTSKDTRFLWMLTQQLKRRVKKTSAPFRLITRASLQLDMEMRSPSLISRSPFLIQPLMWVPTSRGTCISSSKLLLTPEYQARTIKITRTAVHSSQNHLRTMHPWISSWIRWSNCKESTSVQRTQWTTLKSRLMKRLKDERVREPTEKRDISQNFHRTQVRETLF